MPNFTKTEFLRHRILSAGKESACTAEDPADAEDETLENSMTHYRFDKIAAAARCVDAGAGEKRAYEMFVEVDRQGKEAAKEALYRVSRHRAEKCSGEE